MLVFPHTRTPATLSRWISNWNFTSAPRALPRFLAPMGLSDSRLGRSAGSVFPSYVARFLSLPCRASQAPRPIFPRAVSPTTPEGLLAASACCFPNDLVRLHPSRRTGPLRFPTEAESGSLALRLACSPPDSPVPLPRLALVRLHAEQAIYMVNSFQFKRSARLILAYRPKGAEGRKHVTVRNCNKRPQTGESKLKRG